MNFDLIDCCPVPRRLADAIREVKDRSGATLVSCDRSQAAGPYLRQCGKSSQAELYQGYIQGRPGFNPANPPGRSTHERRSDGVAFAGPIGRPLFYWQVGQDWSDAPAVVEAATKAGFTATVTYPYNPREGHHINFRREPILNRGIIQKGDKGHKVSSLTNKLSYLHSPKTGEVYLRRSSNLFDLEVETAVKKFQKDHHQKSDGVVGTQTKRQLTVSVRREKKRREKNLPAKLPTKKASAKKKKAQKNPKKQARNKK